MARRLKRRAGRLSRVRTDNNFVDACCHRIGGITRAGPPAPHNKDGRKR
jgi:hypothetical protein